MSNRPIPTEGARPSGKTETVDRATTTTDGHALYHLPDGQVLAYETPLDEHPEMAPTPSDISTGDFVHTCNYSGVTTLYRAPDGRVGISATIGDDVHTRTIGSKYERAGVLKRNARGVFTHEVLDISEDGRYFAYGVGISDPTKAWYPVEAIVGINEDRKRKTESRREAHAERDAQDQDEVMERIIEHVRPYVEETWPGGTVDVDEIEWFWNPYLRSSWGMAYPTVRSAPKRVTSAPAIGLDWDVFVRSGFDTIAETARHEVIHVWQYEHPDYGRGGHGPDFKQWMDDMDVSF